METFNEADFAVGKEVTINCATFLVYGCDEFTRDYYEKVYGVTFEDIPVQFDEAIERPQLKIPAHVEPGTEEDSLGSFLYLIPKVPKKNFRRMMENDRKILRFMARLDTDAPEDQGRIFVIKYYTQADFYTGARIEFNKFGFLLYQADEYSLSFMESDPESHPMSDISYIAEQLAPVLKEKKPALEAAF